MLRWAWHEQVLSACFLHCRFTVQRSRSVWPCFGSAFLAPLILTCHHNNVYHGTAQLLRPPHNSSICIPCPWCALRCSSYMPIPSPPVCHCHITDSRLCRLECDVVWMGICLPNYMTSHPKRVVFTTSLRTGHLKCIQIFWEYSVYWLYSCLH